MKKINKKKLRGETYQLLYYYYQFKTSLIRSTNIFETKTTLCKQTAPDCS